MFPLIVEYLTQSQSEEERGAWRAPRDLIELIREAEEDLRNHPLAMRPEGFCRPDFYRELLEEDPYAILSAIAAAITNGVPPVEITRHLTLAAAWRLARFAESNDIDDWFGPMHTFSFCNALHQVLARGRADVKFFGACTMPRCRSTWIVSSTFLALNFPVKRLWRSFRPRRACCEKGSSLPLTSEKDGRKCRVW